MNAVEHMQSLWAFQLPNGHYQPKLGIYNYGDPIADENAMIAFLKEAESWGVGVVVKYYR